MTEHKVSLSFTAALRSCAFVNTLTMGTPFPCVPEAFQQWERRSHAFPLEMTPGFDVRRTSRSHLDCLQLDGSRDLEITWSHVWLSW